MVSLLWCIASVMKTSIFTKNYSNLNMKPILVKPPAAKLQNTVKCIVLYCTVALCMFLQTQPDSMASRLMLVCYLSWQHLPISRVSLLCGLEAGLEPLTLMFDVLCLTQSKNMFVGLIVDFWEVWMWQFTWSKTSLNVGFQKFNPSHESVQQEVWFKRKLDPNLATYGQRASR